MKDLLKKSYDINENKFTYRMLIILKGVFFCFLSLIFNSGISNIVTEVEPTFMIWLFALIFIIALFSFIFYHFICIYILEEKIYDYAVLRSLGVSSKNIN